MKITQRNDGESAEGQIRAASRIACEEIEEVENWCRHQLHLRGLGALSSHNNVNKSPQ